jgi:D-serine deaminase-like pyridoxal phosphate-dependent protein
MHAIASEQSLLFRAHVKSHKTAEGTKLQLGEGLKKGEGKLVVSTIAEGWGLVQDGVLDDGTVGHVSVVRRRVCG